MCNEKMFVAILNDMIKRSKMNNIAYNRLTVKTRGCANVNLMKHTITVGDCVCSE